MIKPFKPARVFTGMLVAAILVAGLASGTFAAPSAEAARKCLHYSYIAYPYQRPGSVRMSPDRQNYFKDCMAKEGNVPEPPVQKVDPASADGSPPKT